MLTSKYKNCYFKKESRDPENYLNKVKIVRVCSLSTVVLDSRDLWKIVQLPENFALKNQPCNRPYPKKPAGMHW